MSSRERPPWDFDYAPVLLAPQPDVALPCDLIVATASETASDDVARAMSGLLGDLVIDRLVDHAPIFWLRLRSPSVVRRRAIERALRAAGISLRYVASAKTGDLAVYPLAIERTKGARPSAWRARPAAAGSDPPDDGLWFLREGEGGIGVDRARFGSGAGTRLAVIDNDASEAARLDLDAEVLVLVDAPPRAQQHGALMVAWAAGTKASVSDAGEPLSAFRGVAPDASPRLYCIPKPGDEVIALPLSIVRGVIDGADVIVCSTYVEGSTSPMLSDALELARRLGRRGRGTAVVFPTGREASSPHGSVHSSWSLSLGDPASDPRAFCVGPGGRGTGWFYWLDAKKRLRPFANRGPSVRWLAPGDDLAQPFAPPGRLTHAESSGAAAVAGGALLLVVAANPSLEVREIEAIVTRTATSIDPKHPPGLPALADRRDVLPLSCDADGHSAKHGYGLIHAGRACLVAADPVAAALVFLGETAAAAAWIDRRATDPAALRAYPRRLGRFAVRAMLADAQVSHALMAIVRHLRLLVGHPERAAAQPTGALARQIMIAVLALKSARIRRSKKVGADLSRLSARVGRRLGSAPFEARLLEVATSVLSTARASEPPAAGEPEPSGFCEPPIQA